MIRSSIQTAKPDRVRRAIRALQFGEGNFLRAFADTMLDISNEAALTDIGVAVVKPIPFGSLEALNNQDGLFTTIFRGKSGGETLEELRLVSCVEQAVCAYEEYDTFMALAKLDTLEFVISNTTEAGIVFDETDSFDACPPATFPGKLVKLLHARWEHFAGAADKGLIMIPCELIERNGDNLRSCVQRLIALWKLPEAFRDWVNTACVFCNTLVDRIVTGYPKEEAESLQDKLGYNDALLDVAEPFGLWVIEDGGKLRERLPLHKAGLDVVYTDDMTPYRERKVRILNGAHTSSVLAGYLAGLDTVGELMAHPVLRPFLEKALREEIIPTVPLPEAEATTYAEAVMERFENPFVRHELLSISLNSVSKWKVRVLPSLLDRMEQTGKLPTHLAFSLAALLAFYIKAGITPERDYSLKDDADVLAFFQTAGELDTEALVHDALKRDSFWGQDLTAVPGLEPAVAEYLAAIRRDGVEKALETLSALDQ